MMGLTISAALSYMRERYVNYHLTAIYSVLDYPGIILGGILTTFLFENLLAGLCGLVMIVIGIKIFLTRKSHRKRGIGVDKFDMDSRDESKTPKTLSGEESKEISEKDHESIEKNLRYEKYGVDDFRIVAISSFSGGFLSAMLGFGGGTIKTSSMFLAGVEPKTAAASSELSMTFSATFAAVTHFFLGSFNGVIIWPILIVFGTIIGAQLGVKVCKRVKAHSVQTVFSFIVFYVGILMILSFFNKGIM